MNKLKLYTPAELKASGWLKRQLEIQADSLSGIVLCLVPEQLGKALIHQKAQAKHGGNNQNHCCYCHNISSNYAHRTQSTGMS